MNNLEFKPTKTWIKEHRYRPKSCPDKECFCILDHANHHDQGFCVGICLNDDGDLDIISLCENFYHAIPPDTASRYMLHPNETQLLATYLSFAVMTAWGMLENYRKQLGSMGRKRTALIKKRTKDTKKE